MYPESPLLKALEAALPPVILRENWNHLNASCGLPYRASYVANLNSRGEGPTPHRMGGRKVGYVKSEVLAWLAERSTSSNGGGVR